MKKDTLKFSNSISQIKTSDAESNKIMSLIRQIWQRYDKDGHGYMSKVEAKHFCDRYFKHEDEGVKVVDERIFNEWFKTLDRDGDGRVDVTEIAAYLKVLSH